MNPTILTDFEPKDIKKPFLSYSVWQAYLNCPAAFYFQYFMKIKGPPQSGTGIGSAWDTGMNVYAQQKLNGNLHMADVMQAFDAEYDQQLSGVQWKEKDLFTPKELTELKEKNEGVVPQEEVIRASFKTTKFWKDWGEQKLKEYHVAVGPSIKPIAVQKKFFIDFGDDIPWGLKGTIDRIDEDGAIVDNKTSKTRWSQADVDYDLQGTTYALVYRMLHEGQVENRVQFDILVKTKTQSFEQQFQQLVVGVESHRFDLLLSEMATAYENIKDGRLFRRTHKFTQSCGWCEFRKDCWEPSALWSRLPSPEEIEAFLNEKEGNQELLEGWIEQESAKARLVNWRQVGAELKETIDKNPMAISFWYGKDELLEG